MMVIGARGVNEGPAKVYCGQTAQVGCHGQSKYDQGKSRCEVIGINSGADLKGCWDTR